MTIFILRGGMAWGIPYTSWGGRDTACVVREGLAPAVKHGCVATAGTHPGDAACSVMNSRCPVTPEPRTGVSGSALWHAAPWAAPVFGLPPCLFPAFCGTAAFFPCLPNACASLVCPTQGCHYARHSCKSFHPSLAQK